MQEADLFGSPALSPLPRHVGSDPQYPSGAAIPRVFAF
jgi:hypothetical protein